MTSLAPATSVPQHDTDRLRITEWRLPPGTETGHHVHEFDYVVVPLTDGTLTIYDDAGGEVQAPLLAGQSYHRGAGVSHNVTNQGGAEIRFVEIEIKG